MSQKTETIPQLRKAVDEVSSALDDEVKTRSDEVVAANNRIAMEEITRNNQITNLTTLVGANSLEIAKHTNQIKAVGKKIKSVLSGKTVFDGIKLRDDDGGIWELRINREKKCLEIDFLGDEQESDSADAPKKPEA